jgi:hypothetical protein
MVCAIRSVENIEEWLASDAYQTGFQHMTQTFLMLL